MKVTTSKVDDAAVTRSLVTERDESYIIPEKNVENLTEYNISRTLASANDLKKTLKAYTESLFVMCILLTATHPQEAFICTFRAVLLLYQTVGL